MSTNNGARQMALEALKEAAQGYQAMGWGSQRIDAAIAELEADIARVEPVLWQELSEDGEPLCDEGTFSESKNCFDFERPLFAAPQEPAAPGSAA